MENKYKSILLSEEVYRKLSQLKKAMNDSTVGHLSFGDVIDKLIGNRLALLTMDDSVREYLDATVREMRSDQRVYGILLFGSLARGDFNPYSDVDLLFIIDGAPLEFLDALHVSLRKFKGYEDKLNERGLYLYISPLILTLQDLNSFDPIYLDFLDYGITLYEKNAKLTEFLDKLSKIKHERIITEGGVLLRWKPIER